MILYRINENHYKFLKILFKTRRMFVFKKTICAALRVRFILANNSALLTFMIITRTKAFTQ